MKAKVLSSRECHTNPVFSVRDEKAIEPGGVKIRRYIVEHRGSAVIMPLDVRGRVLLVRQYRLAARQAMWELPAGRIDEGETPLKAARRELIEETGLRAKQWKKLAEFYPSPGFLTEKMTVYLATGLRMGDACPMEDERIECHWFTVAELDELIRAGKLLDGKTLIGYAAWRRSKR
jgi:ADP-ribose pyrophosphatase